MQNKIVDALRGVAKRHSAANWTNPSRAAQHRHILTRCLEEGQQEYPERFDYPEFDLRAYLGDLSEVKEFIDAEAPERFRSALSSDLARMAARATSLSEGDLAYARAAPTIDGLPDETVLERARALLRVPVEDATDADEGTVSAETIAERMRTALDNYGLQEWTVDINESMAAKASVNGTRKRLRIRQGIVLSERAVDRLIVHEIGGHVLRWANAEIQPEPLAGLSIGTSTLTDEGLALWEETRAGLSDPYMERLYAARAIAVDAAQTQGILDVARLVEPAVGLPAAAEIALRVKRGLRNPNAPGGLTKDWAYLGGLIKIGEVLGTGGETLDILRVTKWSVDHLDLARSLREEGLLTEPRFAADANRLALGQQPLGNRQRLEN
ncbi:tyrosine/phenylalanine carboxypeptidase domain-containing protein [Arthrobacter sp. NPDC058288]|uniref:tyrosine/phenylalanine carboxypeptidase domain-containing protein n=1 Tax=Arthrobacter sp. NPDC058288 TaxID=3346424 RepID=UPI0036DFD695